MDNLTAKLALNGLYKLLSVAIISTSLMACGGSGSSSGSDGKDSSVPSIEGEDTKNDPAPVTDPTPVTNPTPVTDPKPVTDSTPITDPVPVVDTTPDTFSFVNQVSIPFFDIVESNSVSVSGLDDAATIAIVGGEYAIDDGPFTVVSGVINSGQRVKLRITAADRFNTSRTATLTIGDISADFSVTTLLDTSAPLASIIFPLPTFSTTSQNITMRGTAIDPENSTITSVLVGGVAATSDDGFATWQASVPVPLGRTIINVTTQDIEGNIDTNAASVSASSGTAPDAFVTPKGIKFDYEHNRAFVIDAGLDMLIAIDLTTRERVVVSSSNVGKGPNFITPTGLDFDILNNRIFVTDKEVDALFAVDLVTGDRTIVTSNSFEADDFLVAPMDVVFDVDNDRALLLDDTFGTGNIYAVDLSTGSRDKIDLSGVAFGDATSIALDITNDQLLVTLSEQHALGSINLTTGERTFLSKSRTSSFGTSVGGGEHDFDAPMSVDIDIENNRALVVDPNIDELGVLFGVDLTTGFRKVLAGPKLDGGYVGTSQSRIDLNSPISVALNTNSGEALLLSAEANNLLRISLDRGTVNTIFAINESTLLSPRGLAFDKDSRKVFTTDFIRSALFSVDLVTAVKRSPSNGSNSAQGPEPELPLAVTYNPDDNSVFLTDAKLGLLTVDLFTGDRKILSSGKIGGGNVKFNNPRSVVLDQENNRALVLSLGSIAAVNLSTGKRTLVSGEGRGVGPAFNTAVIRSDSMVFDKENNRLLVGSAAGFVIEVNLDTGDRTTFTGDSIGEGISVSTGGATGLALDVDNNRLIIMLASLDTLIAVDLTTRNRTILSSPDVGGGTDFETAGEITLDDNNILLVIDSGVDEVIAVDLITGDRVMIAL